MSAWWSRLSLVSTNCAPTDYDSDSVPQMTDLLRRGLLRLKNRPCPVLLSLPGIHQQPFYKYTDLPAGTGEALKTLADSSSIILEEYARLSRDLPQGDYAEESEHSKLHAGNWVWHSAIQRGVWSTDFAIGAPHTAALVGSVPGLMTGGLPWAYAFFSNLKAGANISSHYGPTNTRLRVHIPLRVPQKGGDLGLVVCDERREWVVGEPLIFDDSFSHAAWNHTLEDRLVLLLDIWHPLI